MRCSAIVCCIAVLIVASPTLAGTWYIAPSGSGDAPTIQAGIDSAVAGDTVLVASGTYYEHDVKLKSGIVLSSETGEADCVVIDAEWMGNALFFHMVGSTTIIKGLTLTHGVPARPYMAKTRQ